MDRKPQRTRPKQDRWFDGEPSDAPAPRKGVNERRAAARWHAPKGLTLALIMSLGILLLALIYLRDEPVPWEDDLLRPIFTGQLRDMSAPGRMKMMLLAAARIPGAGKTPLDPWTADLDALGNHLEEHGAVLDNFRDLLDEKPEEWEPRSTLWQVEDFGAAPAWKGVMELKEIEAVHLARRGQEEPAFLAACDLLVLAALLERLDAWPSFLDRSLELHARGTETVARLLARTHLPEEKLRRLQEEEFQPWGPSVERLATAMDGFYAFERKLLLGPGDGEPPVPPGYLPARSTWRIFFKPCATLRLFTEGFRELKNAAGHIALVRPEQIGSRLLRRERAGGLLGGANRDGEDYFAGRIRHYEVLPERNALARARHAIVLTLFAARRFVHRELRLPARLEELKPRYLAVMPFDPFSGESLRYDAARSLVYSVGLNLKDDGGRPTAIPLADPQEPTAEIGIAVARPGAK